MELAAINKLMEAEYRRISTAPEPQAPDYRRGHEAEEAAPQADYRRPAQRLSLRPVIAVGPTRKKPPLKRNIADGVQLRSRSPRRLQLPKHRCLWRIFWCAGSTKRGRCRKTICANWR